MSIDDATYTRESEVAYLEDLADLPKGKRLAESRRAHALALAFEVEPNNLKAISYAAQLARYLETGVEPAEDSTEGKVLGFRTTVGQR